MKNTQKYVWFCRMSTLLLLLSACSDENKDTSQIVPTQENQPQEVSQVQEAGAPVSTQIMDHLQVAAGEEKKVLVDKFVSKNGIEIKGNFIFEIPVDSPVTKVTLEAETGDIVVDGGISVIRQKPEEKKTSFIQKLISPFVSYAYAAESPDASVRGTPAAPDINLVGLSIEIVANTGDIIIHGPSGFVRVEDGYSYDRHFLLPVNFQVVRPHDGGKGGSVGLKALKGNIQLDGAPELKVGNGGKGQGIELNDVTLDKSPSQNTPVQYNPGTAGKGGESGQLVIQTNTLVFKGNRGNNPTEIQIKDGKGGEGGDVNCNFEKAHHLKGLKFLILKAGNGGDGSIEGGNGGRINCQGGIEEEAFTINASGERATTIQAFAGNGGNLNGPYSLPGSVLATAFFSTKRAGDGGGISLLGFKGADGSFGFPGMKGGRVEVTGGSGGGTQGNPSHMGADPRPGNGWMVKGQDEDVIQGGPGGNGGSGCQPNASKHIKGESGGDGGDVIVNGGKGGNNDTMGRGGKGGNIYINNVYPGRGGNGGDGSSPGKGGVHGDVKRKIGQGGHGPVAGEAGSYEGVVPTENFDGSSGGSCGGEPVCGNAIVEKGEECDEGHHFNTDEDTGQRSHCSKRCKKVSPPQSPNAQAAGTEPAPSGKGSNWTHTYSQKSVTGSNWTYKKTEEMHDVTANTLTTTITTSRDSEPTEKVERTTTDCRKLTISKKDASGYIAVTHYSGHINGCPVNGWKEHGGAAYPSNCALDSDGGGKYFIWEDGDEHTRITSVDPNTTYTYTTQCIGCAEPKHDCSCVKKNAADLKEGENILVWINDSSGYVLECSSPVSWRGHNGNLPTI